MIVLIPFIVVLETGQFHVALAFYVSKTIFACMHISGSVSVKRRLRTADCRLRTRGKMQTECKMKTAD